MEAAFGPEKAPTDLIDEYDRNEICLHLKELLDDFGSPTPGDTPGCREVRFAIDAPPDPTLDETEFAGPIEIICEYMVGTNGSGEDDNEFYVTLTQSYNSLITSNYLIKMVTFGIKEDLSDDEYIETWYLRNGHGGSVSAEFITQEQLQLDSEGREWINEGMQEAQENYEGSVTAGNCADLLPMLKGLSEEHVLPRAA